MIRIAFSLVLTAVLAGTAAYARAQEQSEKQVSGPDQMSTKKPTGKSYKKGTKKPSAKQENPSTGQNKRLGNTGDLTKNGDDVNGKRAEAPGNKDEHKK